MPDDLAKTTRSAATLAAMISLLVSTVAPGDDAATTQPSTTQALVSTMPATTQAATTTQATATQPTSAPVVNVVVQLPRPVPTTQELEDRIRKGSVILQTAEAVGSLGLKEIAAKTHWWQWGYALLLAAVGVFLGRLVGGLFRRLGGRESDRLNLIRAVSINSFAGPVALFLGMAGVGFGLKQLDLPPQTRLILIPAFQVTLVLIVGWLLYGLVEVVSLMILRASKGRQGNLSMMIVPVTRRTLRAVLVVGLVLFTANNVLGMSIQTLLAGVGIAGLAVSLAAQDTLKNLFGSVMIFADQPFLIGDTVKVDAFEGVVEDIGFRSTRIRTPDGFLVSIPNAKVADAAITNLSRRKAIRRVVDLGLPYDTPPELVEEALRIVRDLLADAAIDGEFDKNREKPTVNLDQLRPGLLRLRIVYWFRATDARAYAEHAERLNLAIIRRLHDAGIKFGWAS